MCVCVCVCVCVLRLPSKIYHHVRYYVRQSKRGMKDTFLSQAGGYFILDRRMRAGELRDSRGMLLTCFEADLAVL